MTALADRRRFVATGLTPTVRSVAAPRSYPGFGVNPARVGVDVNVREVDLHASTNVIMDVLFKGEVPVGPANNWFLSAGIGPTFHELDLRLGSDQSFFGGSIPSISESTWQTGFAVGAGLSAIACPTCIAGNPLKIGVEGRARFFPFDSINLRSPAIDFVETGSASQTAMDYSVLVTFGVPLVLRQLNDVVIL
jgi:hypothetical protein